MMEMVLHMIIKKKYDIQHKCNTLSGSSGGPILNLLTNKIIGIHKGFIQKKDGMKYNIGTFLKDPLEEINNKKNDIFIPVFNKNRRRKKSIEKNSNFNNINLDNNLNNIFINNNFNILNQAQINQSEKSKPSPNFLKEQDNTKIRKINNSTENYKILNPRPLKNQINDFNNYLNNNFNNSLLKKQFKKPPLIGLKNIKAYCYMNATLQCFCQIESLVNYFKYDKMVDNVIEKYKNENCLTKSFKILIENLWPTSGSEYIKKKYLSKNSNNTYFIPEEFKETISKMCPLFKY